MNVSGELGRDVLPVCSIVFSEQRELNGKRSDSSPPLECLLLTSDDHMPLNLIWLSIPLDYRGRTDALT